MISPALSPKTKITTPVYEETIIFYETLFRLQRAEEWDEPDDRGCILAFSGGKAEDRRPSSCTSRGARHLACERTKATAFDPRT